MQIPKPDKLQLTENQARRLLKIFFGDDLEYYEECIMHLPDDEQKKFFNENPEFMSDYPVSCDKICLLKDKIFRSILRKIKRYEEEHRDG